MLGGAVVSGWGWSEEVEQEQEREELDGDEGSLLQTGLKGDDDDKKDDRSVCTKQQDPQRDKCKMRLCEKGETFALDKCRPPRKRKAWWRYFVFWGTVFFLNMGAGGAWVRCCSTTFQKDFFGLWLTSKFPELI